VPMITSSPAFQQNGLLIVTFDEAVNDSTACCGEVPGPYEQANGIQPGINGPGGGVVGAVLLSPFIAPGTVSTVPYNHYAMLGSIEDLFGLPRLADAAGTTAFGSDVFTRPNGPAPPALPPAPLPPLIVAPHDSQLKLSRSHWSHKHPRTTITYTDSEAAATTFTVRQQLAGYRRGHGACTALAARQKRPKHTSACTAYKSIGSFTHSDTAGTNRVSFRDRVGRHTLAPGRYVLELTPGLGALRGATETARFQVR